MTAQAAIKPTGMPLTPPLPQAKPNSLKLSPARLQLLSDTFKREVDKGTLPGATVMWRGMARSAGLMRLAYKVRNRRHPWCTTQSSAFSR